MVERLAQAAKESEEAAVPKKPLTEEEMAEKIKKLEELRVKKRAEREAQEKADELVSLRLYIVTGQNQPTKSWVLAVVLCLSMLHFWLVTGQNGRKFFRIVFLGKVN